ncbi:MAG: DUF3817 domain-containing protein [Chitinophagales bacterium]|nr:DUF3817 domain-containing protein [Chitinophagales bacterium]
MNTHQIKVSQQIRKVGIAEGISYLFLLFVAMPLKYIWHMPEAVKYTGWAHGVLFIAFMYMILLGILKLNWTFKEAAIAFVASLLPFGTFWLEKKMKQKEHE